METIIILMSDYTVWGYVADKQRVIVAVPPGVGFVRPSMLALVFTFWSSATNWLGHAHAREHT